VTEIRYVTGDATDPIGMVTRSSRMWRTTKAAGVLDSSWPYLASGETPRRSTAHGMPERMVHCWVRGAGQLSRWGLTQFVGVEKDVEIANMVAQHKFATPQNPVALRYGALEDCLNQVRDYAQRLNASVHMPRIGCGLAGGDWNVVEEIIDWTLTRHGIEVFVYDLGTR